MSTQTIILIVCLSIAVLTFLYVILSYLNTKSKYKLDMPSGDFSFHQNQQIPSQLDLRFAGAFVHCKHKLSDEAEGAFSAALLSLARKQYIALERINTSLEFSPVNTIIRILSIDKSVNATENTSNNTTNNSTENEAENEINIAQIPTQTQDLRPELSPYELQVYNLISRHAENRSGGISLTELQSSLAYDFSNTDAFVQNTDALVKNIGMTDGFFQEHDYKRVKRGRKGCIGGFSTFSALAFLAGIILVFTDIGHIYGAFFILGAVFLVSAVLNRVLYRGFVLLTPRGVIEYAKWRAFYEFLKSDRFLKDGTVDDLEKLEDYLIYATAFGISDKVIEALHLRFPNFAQHSAFGMYYGRARFRRRLFIGRSFCRSFRSTTNKACKTSRTGGYGGGYGGGYRGGGGGYSGYGGGRGGGYGGG